MPENRGSMSRQSKADQLGQILSTTRDLSLLQPSVPQREAKARFWASVAETATQVPDPCPLSLAARFGSDSRIPQWWSTPGFQDWFLNREEFKQRIEALAHLSLDILTDILQTGKAGDQLNAVKLILQASSKTTISDQGMLDDEIARMSKDQLKEFIRMRTELPQESPPAPAEQQ